MCAFDVPTGEARDAVVRGCLEDGLIVLPCGTVSVRFRPALTIATTRSRPVTVRAPATGYFTFTDDGDPERRKDKTDVDSARQHRRLDGIENVDHRESSTGFGEKVVLRLAHHGWGSSLAVPTEERR